MCLCCPCHMPQPPPIADIARPIHELSVCGDSLLQQFFGACPLPSFQPIVSFCIFATELPCVHVKPSLTVAGAAALSVFFQGFKGGIHDSNVTNDDHTVNCVAAAASVAAAAAATAVITAAGAPIYACLRQKAAQGELSKMLGYPLQTMDPRALQDPDKNRYSALGAPPQKAVSGDHGTKSKQGSGEEEDAGGGNSGGSGQGGSGSGGEGHEGSNPIPSNPKAGDGSGGSGGSGGYGPSQVTEDHQERLIMAQNAARQAAASVVNGQLNMAEAPQWLAQLLQSMAGHWGSGSTDSTAFRDSGAGYTSGNGNGHGSGTGNASGTAGGNGSGTGNGSGGNGNGSGNGSDPSRCNNTDRSSDPESREGELEKVEAEPATAGQGGTAAADKAAANADQSAGKQRQGSGSDEHAKSGSGSGGGDSNTKPKLIAPSASKTQQLHGVPSSSAHQAALGDSTAPSKRGAGAPWLSDHSAHSPDEDWSSRQYQRSWQPPHPVRFGASEQKKNLAWPRLDRQRTMCDVALPPPTP